MNLKKKSHGAIISDSNTRRRAVDHDTKKRRIHGTEIRTTLALINSYTSSFVVSSSRRSNLMKELNE